MPPNAPPPWLTFMIMFALVSGAVCVIVLIGGVSRLMRGESFWPREEGARPSITRSRHRSLRRFQGSGVRVGSSGTNATLRHQDGTFAGSEGSGSGSQVRDVRELTALSAPAIDPDLPQTLDELSWALEAVRLRSVGEEPTKEAAIIHAFPQVNSKGGGAWQRASKLYDVVVQAQKHASTGDPSIVVESV